MKSSEEIILRENIKEYLNLAKSAKSSKSYNSAVTLLFKATAVLVDLFLLEKEGYIPSNHTERFRLLRNKYPEIYILFDKVFPIYQQSYRLKMSLEYVNELENDFEKIIKITKISL